MKKIILTLMVVTSTLTLAMQSGLAEYKYTQGNYSYVTLDRQEFDALGTAHDRKIAFMEHTGGMDVATGQAGYDEYNYTQKNYSNLKDDDFATRMSRGNNGFLGHVTGQPGYEEYKYIKGIK